MQSLIAEVKFENYSVSNPSYHGCFGITQGTTVTKITVVTIVTMVNGITVQRIFIAPSSCGFMPMDGETECFQQAFSRIVNVLEKAKLIQQNIVCDYVVCYS
jgi:hypothetical protein